MEYIGKIQKERIDPNVYTKHGDWSLMPINEVKFVRWFDNGIKPADLYTRIEAEYVTDYELKKQLPELRRVVAQFVDNRLKFLTPEEQERFGLDAKTGKFILYDDKYDPLTPDAKEKFGDKPKTQEELDEFLGRLTTVQEMEQFPVEAERQYSALIDLMDTHHLTVSGTFQLSDEHLLDALGGDTQKFKLIRGSQNTLLQSLIIHNRQQIAGILKMQNAT